MNPRTKSYRCVTTTAILLLFMVALARGAEADPITLMWDANPVSDRVTGYLVSVGIQSGVYTQTVDVGSSLSYVFPNAVAGQLYYFAVVAYDAALELSPRSAEVSGWSNAPPSLTNPGNQTNAVGSLITPVQLLGSDPLNEAVRYTTTGLPPGLTLQGSTGLITGTGTTAGVFNVTATVLDGAVPPLTASQAFTWTMTVPDATAPAITITGPTSAATFSTGASTVALSGTASDNIGVTRVSWTNNGGASTNATGTTSWSVASIPLQGGANVIVLTARDAAGNIATDTLTVTRTDSTAPVVSITSPTASPTYSTGSATMALGGTASDNIAVTQVTWANSRGGSGTASGTTAWSVSSVALQNGINVITVTAGDAAGNTKTDTLTVTCSALVTVTSLTSSLASPQTTGTAITFTPVASGGITPYQYKYWLYDGAAYTVLRDWSATATFTWTPAQANANYVMIVWARSAGATADTYEGFASKAFPITAGGGLAPLDVTALNSTLSAPQGVGTAITFTPAVTGGTTPYQYKYWLYDGAAYTVLRDWSATPTLTWTPAQVNANYLMIVWVRSAGATADTYEDYAYKAFPITGATGPALLDVTALNSTLSPPQRAGTAITFTPAVTGGTTPYQYKYWLYDGAAYTVLRDWSATATFTWTPTQANANYLMIVWVRSAGATADTYEDYAYQAFVINP